MLSGRRMSLKRDKEPATNIANVLEEDDDAKDFISYLQEANQTDLSDIERSGCVSEGKDLKDVRLIVMIPSLGLNRIDKPEVQFRKMLLFFIKKTNEMVGALYSIVYAHTNIDIINQYPLIYKFYSVLPRSYKKNLQKMYIIHPNVGIKMFFEFSRVFLSPKFYQKLCLVESILEFQRIVPPTQLALPLKFLYKEDEERELKYCGNLASLSLAYEPHLGTTKIIDVCTTFLRENGGLKSVGIFRIPGDEGEVNLARVRLQYANIDGFTSSGRIEIAPNRKSIIIGDFDSLYPQKTEGKGDTPVNSSSSAANTTSSNPNNVDPHMFKKLSKQELEIEEGIPTEVPMSVVVITNINTVGHILKCAIRDLPEPLIPEDVYRDLVDITRSHTYENNLGSEWDAAISKRLSVLPVENISTFAHMVSFLREVARESKSNNMGADNLATVFAPTIFRSGMDDPIKAVMEIKFSQNILLNIIQRENILKMAIKMFKDSYRHKHGVDRNLTENPVLVSTNLTNHMSLELMGTNDFNEVEKNELADITSTISPAMMSRMFGRGNGATLSGGRGETSPKGIISVLEEAEENGDEDDKIEPFEVEEEEEEQQQERQQQSHQNHGNESQHLDQQHHYRGEEESSTVNQTHYP